MKAKKMLISIALIIVMLLNCVAPVVQVQAATEKTTLTFNRTLYKSLKTYFTEKGIKAVYNDGLHTIKMENSVIANVKELSLKEKGIKDITGLDSFTGVERLILSGNELDENSNLSILNNFENLNYLDISSNQISDITEIQSLVERLIALDSNAINLTGQIVRKVIDVSQDSQEEKTEVSYDLPQILQIAGIATEGTIKNKGSIKSDWISHDRYYQTQNGADGQPTIIDSTIPSIVTEANKSFNIKVGSETTYDGYTQYEGLIKLVIKIKDVATTSYTYNPASENILKDSIFTLYYAVHSDEFEGVIFEDNNFYNAVKEQLTKDQTINDDLLSYKYTVIDNGDKYYDVCDVSLAGTTATLKIDGTTVYTIYNFNATGYD